MSVIHVTDASFNDDVLQNKKPVLVDFWAEWCTPCKRIAPTLEEIAQEQTDVVVCKVDIVANPKTKDDFDIKGVPSLILFKNGQIIGRKVGALSKSQILDFLNQATTELES